MNVRWITKIYNIVINKIKNVLFVTNNQNYICVKIITNVINKIYFVMIINIIIAYIVKQ